MSRIGYARVSTGEQDPALQHDALTGAGCERIFTDTASGARTDRPQLGAALDYLRPGDQLVVWRLDRLGRDLPHLITTIETLHRGGVQFQSVTEDIDTTTAQGQLLLAVFGAFAQFERAILRERTRAGLAAARRMGRLGGRPRVLTAPQIRYAQRMHAAHVPVTEIAAGLSCARATVYRALQLIAA